MLRVENGVLIIDGNDYWQAGVYNLRPNVPITIKILEGSAYIGTRTSEGNYSPGDTVVVQVESTDEEIIVGKDTSDTARFLITYESEAPVVADLYEQKAIVPAAVSSQLDVTGEERIHIAPYEEKDSTPPPPPPAGDCLSLDVYQYGATEFNSISEWVSDALPEATFRHLVITNAPTLEEALLLDYWFIVLEISREGPDFYSWYVNDLDGPFANYGDPPNYVEANGFLAILASEEGIQPITLAQGCVHANLFGGAT